VHAVPQVSGLESLAQVVDAPLPHAWYPVAQVKVHAPPVHAATAFGMAVAQALPHTPQLLMSSRETQVPPHCSSVAAHERAAAASTGAAVS
jgi:hypothetical protein